MTNDSVFFILLLVFCAVLLISNLFLWIYFFKTVKCRKKDRSGNEQPSEDTQANPSDLPKDILLVLISAAVAATLGKKKSSGFRVVSFRRAGRK